MTHEQLEKSIEKLVNEFYEAHNKEIQSINVNPIRASMFRLGEDVPDLKTYGYSVKVRLKGDVL